MEYNFKDEKIDLKRSISHELDGKLKSYIKGVTNAEELKQDSKVHDESSDKGRKINIKKMEKIIIIKDIIANNEIN